MNDIYRFKTLRTFTRDENKDVKNDCITVAVSLFNYRDVIMECLDSVAAQTYKNLDLIVVDDCSTDRDCVNQVSGWLRKNERRFSKCLFVQHELNSGLAAARNTAFRISTCQSIFVMDADNRIFPTAISKLNALLQASGMAAAYSQLVFFGDEKKIGIADIWSRERFASGNYVDAMSLVRRDAWEKVGGYTHIEGGWEDFDFWCKLIDADLEAIFLPEIVCCYRVHGNSMLRTETREKFDRVLNVLNIRHPWLELRSE